MTVAGGWSAAVQRLYSDDMSDVTRLLDAAAAGDRKAAADLLPVVYDELRRLAAAHLAAEPAGHVRVGGDGPYMTGCPRRPVLYLICGFVWRCMNMRKLFGLALGVSVAVGLGCSRGRPTHPGAAGAPPAGDPAPPAPSRGAPATAAGLERLHGTWTGTEERGQPITLTFGPGDAVLVRVGPDTAQGTYAVDWGQTPAHLDLDWGRKVRTIVEFTPGGGLRMEDRGPGQDRPRQFSPKAKVLTRAGGR